MLRNNYEMSNASRWYPVVKSDQDHRVSQRAGNLSYKQSRRHGGPLVSLDPQTKPQTPKLKYETL